MKTSRIFEQCVKHLNERGIAYKATRPTVVMFAGYRLFIHSVVNSVLLDTGKRLYNVPNVSRFKNYLDNLHIL